MNRTLVAAAFAAVLLPAGAFEAAAAPAVATPFTKTYALQCQANASDGAALKIRIMVKNTSGHVIKQGTKITLHYTYGYGRPRQPRIYVQTQIAYRDVLVNDSIGLDQPIGLRRCTATVTLRPDLQTKIKLTR